MLLRGTVSTALVTGDRNTHKSLVSTEHISCVHVYEVVGAIKLEGVGAQRHFETTER